MFDIARRVGLNRSGVITSGGAALNIRLTDWDDHRSRPRQQRDIAMRAVTVPPSPGDGFLLSGT